MINYVQVLCLTGKYTLPVCVPSGGGFQQIVQESRGDMAGISATLFAQSCQESLFILIARLLLSSLYIATSYISDTHSTLLSEPGGDGEGGYLPD